MATNDRLKNARMQKRWSMEHASEMVGISKTTWVRWETGEQKPHPTTLDLLCKTFEMAPEELGFEELEPQQAERKLIVVRDQLILPEGSDMDRKRRLLLQTTAGIILAPHLISPESWDRLVSEPARALADETALNGFEKATEACWNLSNGNELAVSEQILPTYLPKLAQIARNPSKFQQRAASLVSESLQLGGILAAHKLDFTAKEVYSRQAVNYAKLAGDYNAQVAALIQVAVAYYYQQRPEKALEVYQEAILYIRHLTPLMQSRTYMGAAEAYAKNGMAQDALYYSGLAFQVFPDNPKEDQAYRYADWGMFALLEHAGLIHNLIQQPKEALENFAQVSKYPVPERIRLEVVNYQTSAAIAQQDLEMSCSLLETGINGAHLLGSHKRLSEAETLHQQMVEQWPREKRVKALAELFQR